MPPNRQQGWYPDPDRPGLMRWWDGSRWSGQGAAVGPDQGSEPDGFAMAAFVTGLLGIPIAPIYLGLKARTRIRESGGTKDGNGLAITGVALGVVELVLLSALLVLAVTG